MTLAGRINASGINVTKINFFGINVTKINFFDYWLFLETSSKYRGLC